MLYRLVLRVSLLLRFSLLFSVPPFLSLPLQIVYTNTSCAYRTLHVIKVQGYICRHLNAHSLKSFPSSIELCVTPQFMLHIGFIIQFS